MADGGAGEAIATAAVSAASWVESLADESCPTETTVEDSEHGKLYSVTTVWEGGCTTDAGTGFEGTLEMEWRGDYDLYDGCLESSTTTWTATEWTIATQELSWTSVSLDGSVY